MSLWARFLLAVMRRLADRLQKDNTCNFLFVSNEHGSHEKYGAEPRYHLNGFALDLAFAVAWVGNNTNIPICVHVPKEVGEKFWHKAAPPEEESCHLGPVATIQPGPTPLN